MLQQSFQLNYPLVPPTVHSRSLGVLHDGGRAPGVGSPRALESSRTERVRETIRGRNRKVEQ